uniref:Phospholipase-like protein n=1 Tax=Tanacetum cinerariifolium TaxID=118510 RepID=A0A699JTM0_TANCI|nr:hypothetical protein [Tanacetum cinerariifolium]
MLRVVDDLADWNDFPWEMGQNWCKRSYDYLDVKEKSVPLDNLGGVSQDDESDAFTRQDGRGATVGAKVSGECNNRRFLEF